MPNPWDIKLVSELSEHEMLGYVDHLQVQMTLEREEYIEAAVSQAVEHWRSLREARTLLYPRPAEVFYVPPQRTLGWLGGEPEPLMPETRYTYRRLSIKVYPWMDEEVVRYVAREQIIEQTTPDRG